MQNIHPLSPGQSSCTTSDGSHSASSTIKKVEVAARKIVDNCRPPIGVENFSRRNISLETSEAESEGFTLTKICKTTDFLPRITEYQIQLLLLFNLRRIADYYLLHSSRQIENPKEYDPRDAGKFDDIIMGSFKGYYDLVRVEHDGDSTQEITLNDLLNAKGGPLSLVDYFRLYVNTKEHSIFSNSVIRCLVILTTKGFNEELKGYGIDVRKEIGPIDPLDVKTAQNEELIRKLRSALKENECRRLAKTLVECLLSNKPIGGEETADIFSPYRRALFEKVIDVKRRTFHLNFLTGKHLSQNTIDFRSIFIEELTKQSAGKVKIESLNRILQRKKRPPVQYKEIALNVPDAFTIGHGPYVSSSPFEDKKIKYFLSHLIFVGNQPRQQELRDQLLEKISRRYALQYFVSEIGLRALIDNMGKLWAPRMKNQSFLTMKRIDEVLQEAKQEYPLYFNARGSVYSFTGREKELDDLHDLMKDCGTVVVTGLGGVGKTQLAIKYAWNYSKHYENGMIWIECESQADLTKCFLELAGKLGIRKLKEDRKPRDIEWIVKEIYQFFAGRSTLFVFNGAKIYSDLEKFLPRLPDPKDHPYILITSRQTKWLPMMDQFPLIKQFNLDPFTPKEAIEFIKKKLEITNHEQDKAVTELAEICGYLPLALQYAVECIKREDTIIKCLSRHRQFGISDYLKEYQQYPEKFLNFEFPRHFFDPKTPFTTWAPTLDDIEKEGGNQPIEMLCIMAYLAPDTMIPTRLLASLIGEKEWQGAVALLKNHSMVYVQQDPTFLGVHRLVQQVIRLIFKEQEERILRKALEVFTDQVTFVDHARSVWYWASKHDNLAEEFSSLPYKIISELMSHNRFEEANLFAAQAFEFLADQLGPNHRDTLTVKKVCEIPFSNASVESKYDSLRKVGQEKAASSSSKQRSLSLESLPSYSPPDAKPIVNEKIC